MNHSYIISELKNNASVFEQLLKHQSEEQYLWKQQPDKWCLLEIVCHLYDEERDDFRSRLNHVLKTPELPLPPTDPVGWVTSRKYMDQDFYFFLDGFLSERKETIEWLRSLKNPAWKNVHHHPKVGAIPADLFLINWLAHDLLHIRQIVKLKYDYLKSTTEIKLDYAGNW